MSVLGECGSAFLFLFSWEGSGGVVLMEVEALAVFRYSGNDRGTGTGFPHAWVP